MNRTSPWWLTLQAIAIVASILLAFAIEAWWSAREEDEVEQIYLEALLQDLKRLQSLRMVDENYNQAILSSTIRLIRIGTEDEIATINTQELDQLIGDLVWFNGGNDWNSGPLTALYEGGELSNISNPELRLVLTRLHNKISSLQALYENDSSFHHDTLVPFLIARTDWAQITQVTRKPDDPDFDYNYPSLQIAKPYSHADLVGSREFRSLLVGKMDRQLDIVNFGLPGVAEELTVAIDLVERELADR